MTCRNIGRKSKIIVWWQALRVEPVHLPNREVRQLATWNNEPLCLRAYEAIRSQSVNSPGVHLFTHLFPNWWPHLELIEKLHGRVDLERTLYWLPIPVSRAVIPGRILRVISSNAVSSKISFPRRTLRNQACGNKASIWKSDFKPKYLFSHVRFILLWSGSPWSPPHTRLSRIFFTSNFHANSIESGPLHYLIVMLSTDLCCSATQHSLRAARIRSSVF